MTFNIDRDTGGRLTEVLAAARQDGEARIRTDSGEEYVLRPATKRQALNVLPSLHLNLSAAEIVEIVREGRKRDPA